MHIYEEVKDHIPPHHPGFSHMATFKSKGGWEYSLVIYFRNGADYGFS